MTIIGSLRSAFADNPWQVVLGCLLANAIDVYDMSIYLFFAPILAKTFFISSTQTSSLIIVLTFCLSFIARPVGAYLFGRIAQSHGLNISLFYAIITISLATSLIALLPGSSTWGPAALVGLLVLRICQSAAFAGEYTGGILYLVESGHKNSRYLRGGIAVAGANSGMLVAAAVYALLTHTCSAQQLVAWGWRIAFAAAIPAALLGFWFRRNFSSMPHLRKQTAKTLFNSLCDLKYQYLTVVALTWFGVMCSYSIFILSKQSLLNAHIQSQWVMPICLVTMTVLIGSILYHAQFTDKGSVISRLENLVVLVALLAIFYYQALALKDARLIIIALLAVGLAAGGYLAIAPILLTQILPAQSRCLDAAVLYNTTAAVFSAVAVLSMTYWPMYYFGYSLMSAHMLLVAILLLASLRAIQS